MVFWIFCKLNLLFYIRALLHKWRRQTVLKSGTGQSNLANYSRLSLHHTQRLPQGLAEQALDAQAELDGCVREGRTASALAARRAKPSRRIPGSSHIHRQRAALYAFQFVVRYFLRCLFFVSVAPSVYGRHRGDLCNTVLGAQ